MERVAVLIPGIMGSSLWHDDGSGRVDIWAEDFSKTYRGLIRATAPLAWVGKKASAEVMKKVWFSPSPWRAIDLWGAIETYVAGHPEFGQPARQVWFGYDWRQSLLESAKDLGAALSAHTGENVAAPPPIGSETRFVIIAHSMGGVLARVAVGRKELHPGWLERVITIGSPLQGAPQALNSLYGTVSPIPYLTLLIRLFHPVNGQPFFDALRLCMQSFPSAYQLLPHKGWSYLYRGPQHASNALDENDIPTSYKEGAREAHEAVRIGGRELAQAHTTWRAIYTRSHPSRPTEMLYQVRSGQGGYDIEKILLKTDLGDGTVPALSATDGHTASPPALPVTAVTHHKMCNDTSVLNQLRLHIG